MRDIRFRAWDKNAGIIFFVGQISFKEEQVGDVGNPANHQTWRNVGDCVLMQYTGLNDKNGNEIYEGDIVKSKEFGIKEVYWDNDFSCWRIGRGCEQEVIGNIYEHPELLTP